MSRRTDRMWKAAARVTALKAKPELVEKVTRKFQVGDKVYHRNLRLNGVVVDPPFLGVDVGFTELVEFEDGETREVSVHLLEAL